jgi:hypothetical protein
VKKDHVLNSIHRASHETSRLVGAHLRSEAKANGWPSHVVRSTSVSYSKNGFAANVSEKHHAEALDYEYGTPSRQPSGAIRHTANRTAESENFLVNRLFQHLEAYL